MIEWYESTLGWRVAFGVTFFAVLGLIDWLKNPGDPRRLREYGFLLYGTAVATAYGILHDQVTVTISPEYFVVFKNLRPGPGGLRWAALKLSVLATYWVGVVLAAALLVANNPSDRLPQLAYARLRRLALIPIGGALVGALAGAMGLGVWGTAKSVEAFSGYLPVDAGAFLTVWGMHIGSYAGGGLGGAVAVWRVRVERYSREIVL
jgi:hypothetical protein